MKYIIVCLLCVSTYLLFADPCSDCKGTGWIETTCKVCKGEGFIRQQKSFKVKSYHSGFGLRPSGYTSSRQTMYVEEPCEACFKGLRKPGSRGTGTVKVKCATCRGKGFIFRWRKNKHKSTEKKNVN